MRIAVDASRTTVARRTGTENYALQLIRALLDLPGAAAHQFSLYFRNRPPETLLKSYPNVQHRIIPLPRLWTHVRFAGALWMERPDVTFVPAHTLPLLFPGRAVVTIHDLGYRFFPEAHPESERRYLDRTTRFSARRATRILADSEATRRDLVTQYNVDAQKIAVVYPGVEGLSRAADSQITTVRAKYQLPEKYFLFLGTLQPRKNIKRLLDAFQIYRQNGGDVALVLAGKQGWLIRDILTDARIASMDGKLILPGYIDDQDVAAVYSGALALTFPSLYEGFGFPVLEAMRCGTPVLCANTSSLPELAGDAALLVDPLSVQTIADGMARLARDSNLRAELTARGYPQAETFTWQRAALETLRILENI